MKELTEIENQIQNLSNQVYELNVKIGELKAERNQILTESDELSKLLGKYIIFRKYDDTIYLKVEKIDRASYGTHISGFSFCCSGSCYSRMLTTYVERTVAVTISDLESIKEITKEEFLNAWKELVSEFDDVIKYK